MDRTPLTGEEIEVLTFMHEHVLGFSKEHSIEISHVVERLNLSEPLLLRALAFLEGTGLIGVVKGAVGIQALWLPLKGENLIREIEAGLIRESKLTPGVALTHSFLEMGDAGVKDHLIQRIQRFLAGAKVASGRRAPESV